MPPHSTAPPDGLLCPLNHHISSITDTSTVIRLQAIVDTPDLNGVGPIDENRTAA
jgi:hypothetical protein